MRILTFGALVTLIICLCLMGPSGVVGAPKNEGVLAFRDVSVFDGSRMLRHMNVIIRDGMIREVASNAAIPESFEVVEGQGKTLLPGFIDSHTHLGQTQPEVFLKDALNFGVTTELEMFGSSATLKLRKRLAEIEGAGLADFRTAGIGVTVPKGHPTQMGGGAIPTLSSNEDVQAFIDARIAEGADYIKIIDEHRFPTLAPNQIAEIVVAAHRRNKIAVAHIASQKEAYEAIAAGVDGLAHIFADVPPESGLSVAIAQHHAFVIPTLTVFEAITLGIEEPWWKKDLGLTTRLTPSMRVTLQMKMPPTLIGTNRLANAQEAVAQLYRAGVRILAGTDAPAPGIAHGVSLHHELELLVGAGLSPLQAISAATEVPARTFGLHDRGRIAVGLRADLLLVEGDPSKEVATTRNIVGVWKLGHSSQIPVAP